MKRVPPTRQVVLFLHKSDDIGYTNNVILLHFPNYDKVYLSQNIIGAAL